MTIPGGSLLMWDFSDSSIGWSRNKNSIRRNWSQAFLETERDFFLVACKSIAWKVGNGSVPSTTRVIFY